MLNATQSNKKVKVFLSDISYRLEDFHQIEEISERKNSTEALLKAGFKNYYTSKHSLLEMAKVCAQTSLEKAGIDRNKFSHFIYATSSLWDSNSYNPTKIGNLLCELALENAYPIGLFLSQCGNVQSEIAIAYSLIKSETSQNILITSTDKVQDEDTRIVAHDFAVMSDAAVSSIISTKPGKYEIVTVVQNSNPTLSLLDLEKNFEGYLLLCLEEINKTLSIALERINKSPEDVTRMFMNNYSLETIKDICRLSGFKVEQVYTDNLQRYGHAFAADNLIGLYDFSNQYSTKSGDLFILLGLGFSTWVATIIYRV